MIFEAVVAHRREPWRVGAQEVLKPPRPDELSLEMADSLLLRSEKIRALVPLDPPPHFGVEDGPTVLHPAVGVENVDLERPALAVEEQIVAGCG